MLTLLAQTTPTVSPRAERHGDDIAGLKLHPARHAIRIGVVERHRHQNIDEWRDHAACVWPIPGG